MSLPRIVLASLAALGLAAAMHGAHAQERGDALVLIGHGDVPRMDAATAQRVYTGRVVELGGVALVAVNAAPGSKARERFLAGVVSMDEERYTGYWTVRRHVGKGTPPRELRSAAEVIDFVQATPGAVGYVLASELKSGLNVVLRP